MDTNADDAVFVAGEGKYFVIAHSKLEMYVLKISPRLRIASAIRQPHTDEQQWSDHIAPASRTTGTKIAGCVSPALSGHILSITPEDLMADTPTPESKPSRRGFAGMDAAKQREIAAKGGRAAHRSGNAHEFDSEEARAAGRAGGRARALNRTRGEEVASDSPHVQWSDSDSTQRDQARVNRPEEGLPAPRPSTH